MEKLTDNEIAIHLVKLKGWKHENQFIVKEFVFDSHLLAFTFLTKVAFTAERLNHHPNWSGVFNTVCIKLTTHDLHGVTMRDISFAAELESLME